MRTDKFIIYIDHPTSETIYNQTVSIDGWLVPTDGRNVKNLRTFNGLVYSDIVWGRERNDVAAHFSDMDEAATLHSGFYGTVFYQGKNVILEADFGDGYQQVYEFVFEDKTDKLFEKYYNPQLAEKWAEHQDTITATQKYHYEQKRESPVDRGALKTKLITFYLPQFHPIPENNRAWGEGFTEWSNVASATPKFVGHNQPMEPADLGYYDLRLDQSIKEQIELATHYGIYGFCIYYYWFSGKKILETPINTILRHEEWDFNFCICWANENWTKRWDGQDSEVIIQQKYTKDDPLNFIKDVEHILLDKRYIRHEGKPVYRPEHTKNPDEYVRIWREYFKTTHGTDLHIVSVLSFSSDDPGRFGMDAAVRFSPSGLGYAFRELYDSDMPSVDVSNSLLDKNFNGHVHDYRAVTLDEAAVDYSYDFATYPCVMPSWDNDARKKGNGISFVNSTPELYERWLDRTLSRVEDSDPFVFVNAWNEWAEGTVLEPTKQYGHAFLRRTAASLEKVSGVRDQNLVDGFRKRPSKKKLAVVVHLYYIDQWSYLREKIRLLNMNTTDIFVVLRQTNAYFSEEIQHDFPGAQTVVYPNRGRDILPFLMIARKLRTMGYSAILKLHTKKSHHRDDGKKWFNDIVEKLLPNAKGAQHYAETAVEGAAFIGPDSHIVSLERYIGGNEEHLRDLLQNIYDTSTAAEVLSRKGDYYFMAGSMFYMSMDAIDPILDLYLDVLDFETEKAQIDGTMAHAVERLFSIVMQIEGHTIYRTSRVGVKRASRRNATRRYKYAP